MKIVVFGLVGLIFLGLLLGGTRVLGENDIEGRAVAQNVQIPQAKILPGHPFYALKELGRTMREVFSFSAASRAKSRISNLEERLTELHGLLVQQDSSSRFSNAVSAYKEDLKNISKYGVASESVASAILPGLFETSFYQTQALSRLGETFPDAAESLFSLREDIFVVLRNVTLAAPSDFSIRVSQFTKNPFPAIGFLDKVARMIDEPSLKARVLGFQGEIVSEFRGQYLAGAFRLGVILDFFSQGGDSFERLRILDTIREAFSGEELGNQLQFLRQELLQGKNGFFLNPSVLENEVDSLGRVLPSLLSFAKEKGARFEETFTDADFNYDRALEFYSAGLFDRALAQASLSLSSLHPFLQDVFQEPEQVRQKVNLLRDEFLRLKKTFAAKGKNIKPQVPLFLKRAEEDIVELLIAVGKKETSSFSLLSHTRSLLVALEELR